MMESDIEKLSEGLLTVETEIDEARRAIAQYENIIFALLHTRSGILARISAIENKKEK